jgi:AcrR family transcriptional regulator
MSKTKQTPSETKDGRARRSERSRQLIIDAMMALIEDGNLEPTAQQVSDRAEVGIRTVFRHFSDMESLFASADETLRQAYEDLFLGGDRNGTLQERILHAVERHDRAFEKLQNILLSTQSILWKSQTLQGNYARNIKGLRKDLEDWLPEFKKLSPSRKAAAETVMGFETWHRLRHLQGLSNKTTVHTINELVCLLFDIKPG